MSKSWVSISSVKALRFSGLSFVMTAMGPSTSSVILPLICSPRGGACGSVARGPGGPDPSAGPDLHLEAVAHPGLGVEVAGSAGVVLQLAAQGGHVHA